jgi:molybdopterin-guanine dinucleotide biosynthesis protein MobB
MNDKTVISIVGKSGSGKTTLLENIIREMKKRGYRIGTIKHHAHPGFEIDHQGKDTWRHAQAGSDHVVIAAPDKIASIRLLEEELSLEEIISGLHDIDIIFTDGYKSAGKPAIEVIRKDIGIELICQIEQLIAIATDHKYDIQIPQFDLDDTLGIVEFLISHYSLLPSDEQNRHPKERDL